MSESLREIKVPPLGESVREATVTKWRKAVGDAVKQDEVLVELETDKVTMEVGAPATGVLQEISASSGQNIEVGGRLGTIAEGAVAEGATPWTVVVESPSDTESKAAAKSVSKKTSEPREDEALPPSVRKMLEESGVKSADVPGSGKGGRLTKGDVIGFLDTPKSAAMPSRSTPQPALQSAPLVEPSFERAPARTSERREERVKMTRLRAKIAERLKMAQNTAAILTTFNEIDMSAVNALRARYKESFEKRHGVKLGMMSFFVKAVVQALKEVPAVNAEIDGEEIIYKNYYDIGIAVSTPTGLVVPVARGADQLTFAEIEKEIAYLGHRARDGKLTIEDMKGGTVTITNGGIFGSLMATPIINPPQTGILGMHKTQDRPVVVDGQIVIRPMMYVALSYDHRLIDGKESVTFLVRVKENLENPERLLLDM